MNVPELITAAQHAHAQIESLIEGSTARLEALEEAATKVAEVYGGDVGKVLAISCAVGAEKDTATALATADRALLQEIEHLQALASGS